MCRANQQGIKPPTRLIDSFANEVRWEVLLEGFFVFERIVNLCVWHTRKVCVKGACTQRGEYRPARFKPAIKYFFDTLENPFSLFRRDGYMVDTLTVKVRDPGYARQFF